MDNKELLTLAAKAAGMVTYNSDTGKMHWLEKPLCQKDAVRWNRRYAGKECGTIDDKGYRRILFRLDGCKTFKIRTHRLAWYFYYGVLPKGEIDHINQDKLDNRISNLRDVPKSLNLRNAKMQRNNTSGVTGVVKHKQSGKWCAQANINGKHIHIGSFIEKSDAEDAVLSFRQEHSFTELHGFKK